MTTNEMQLEYLEINPKHSPKHSIIWMHGLGADANDFVPMVEELRLPDELALRFVFPNAPVMPITINNGYEMRAWYDITGGNLQDRIDHAGIQKSVLVVRALIQQELDRGLPAESIMLGGFSQGAVMALTVGLCYPERLGGIIALSGYLPLLDDVLRQAPAANKQIPIFLGHGTEDSLVPHRLSQVVYESLQAAGYSASMHSYAMPHTVCAEEIGDIRQWLERIL
jgi:phospholipase/carboxylesterase